MQRFLQFNLKQEICLILKNLHLNLRKFTRQKCESVTTPHLDHPLKLFKCCFVQNQGLFCPKSWTTRQQWNIHTYST